MTSAEIVEKLKASFPDDIQDTALPQGDAVIFVAPDRLQKVAGFLKDDPSLKFDYLSDVCGVDYLNEEREPRFEAVYNLHSIDHQHSIRIRVGIEEDNPSVPTVSEFWKGALYPEQELFDMFGIHVEGHPKNERLIMPKEWAGYPLRKDYPLTTETVTFSYNRDFKSDLVKSKPPTR
ncbi:MAG: NADH-quinone oxidoreductase subunit C [Nitrospinae bacterium CG22_combo_CG10-13_8_21_14_all_47_10]|nr:MAG: NADH-quinone oxidoreductase subunit C [Nitrospinae bacterium CG22_combo_CG10-13_8_21_14_all_47_10]